MFQKDTPSVPDNDGEFLLGIECGTTVQTGRMFFIVVRKL